MSGPCAPPGARIFNTHSTPPPQCFWTIGTKFWFTTLNGGRGWRGKFMAVLSVKEFFFLGERVSFSSKCLNNFAAQ